LSYQAQRGVSIFLMVDQEQSQIHHLEFCATLIIDFSGRLRSLIPPRALVTAAVLTKMTGQI
jgi:hypothetical protein